MPASLSRFSPSAVKTLLKEEEKGVHFGLRMPRSAVNDSLWATMTAAQKSEAVSAGRATLRQMVAGLLDGPDEVGRSCREFLTRMDASLEELSDTVQVEQPESNQTTESESVAVPIISDQGHDAATTSKRRRLGLPRGYSPRLHRRKRLV
jgi:hypothetical protein